MTQRYSATEWFALALFMLCAIGAVVVYFVPPVPYEAAAVLFTVAAIYFLLCFLFLPTANAESPVGALLSPITWNENDPQTLARVSNLGGDLWHPQHAIKLRWLKLVAVHLVSGFLPGAVLLALVGFALLFIGKTTFNTLSVVLAGFLLFHVLLALLFGTWDYFSTRKRQSGETRA